MIPALDRAQEMGPASQGKISKTVRQNTIEQFKWLYFIGHSSPIGAKSGSGEEGEGAQLMYPLKRFQKLDYKNAIKIVDPSLDFFTSPSTPSK